MKYIEKWKIKKEDLKKINMFFDISFDNKNKKMEKLIEYLGARQDDYIGITDIIFKNGNYITIDLASGNNNYYDNIVLWNNKGQEIYCLECSFEIGDIEFEYNNDIYKIIIEEK